MVCKEKVFRLTNRDFCFGCCKVPRGGDLLVHVGILIKSTIVAFGALRVNVKNCDITLVISGECSGLLLVSVHKVRGL